MGQTSGPTRRTLATVQGPIVVQGAAPRSLIASLRPDPGLRAFRPPDKQKEALLEICGLPEGRITIAYQGDLLVGYVTYHHPDSFERWGEGRNPGILELGAIEVSPAWRSGGLGKALLEVSFEDDWFEDFIVVSTEYYWHWDLQGTSLSLWHYRDMLEAFFARVGFERRDTDEPDIASHPCNMLMVRVGGRVPEDLLLAFEALRYKDRPFFA
ncbi:MAG: GNAT family N-acetyltransferase [Symbiobacteriia bacterium]